MKRTSSTTHLQEGYISAYSPLNKKIEQKAITKIVNVFHDIFVGVNVMSTEMVSVLSEKLDIL